MALQVYPTATLTRSQGMVFLFRWPCYQIQVNTPVDVWSNHACQVALFFPSINTACSSRSVRSCPASELLAQVGGSHSFFPGLQEMHPSATRRAREPTGGVLSKVGQEDLSRWSCCHWIMGKECTLTPSSRSESELLDLHGPRGPRPTGNRGGLKKKQRQTQTVQTEENSQKEE